MHIEQNNLIPVLIVELITSTLIFILFFQILRIFQLVGWSKYKITQYRYPPFFLKRVVYIDMYVITLSFITRVMLHQTLTFHTVPALLRVISLKGDEQSIE